jgi:ATP-dependent Zn protease
MIIGCLQNTTGQIRNRKSGPSGTKSSEQGETVTFADIAGVDEAKEELEEIVVGHYLIIFGAYNLQGV